MSVLENSFVLENSLGSLRSAMSNWKCSVCEDWTHISYSFSDFILLVYFTLFAQNIAVKLTLPPNAVAGGLEDRAAWLLVSWALKTGPWVISVLSSQSELCGGQRGRQRWVWCVGLDRDLRLWFVEVHQTGVDQNLNKSPQWHQWQNLDNAPILSASVCL